MFLIKDSVDDRKKVIESFLRKGQASIALLLSVIDLERTLRRTILALGRTRTKELNAQMGTIKDGEGRRFNEDSSRGPIRYRSGLTGLHEAWKVEVQSHLKRKLPGDLSPTWSIVRDAVELRNKLVHGSRGPTTREFAQGLIKAVLDLIGALDKFAKANGHDLQNPVRRRLKDRPI